MFILSQNKLACYDLSQTTSVCAEAIYIRQINSQTRYIIKYIDKSNSDVEYVLGMYDLKDRASGIITEIYDMLIEDKIYRKDEIKHYEMPEI